LSLCHCFRRFFDGRLKRKTRLHQVFFSFCGKQQQKLSQCFERLSKKKLGARQGFTNGFLGSNVVTCHLKTNRDLGVLQQAEPTETFKKIRDAIMSDRRRTIDELEALTAVTWSSCQRILTEELHMKRVATKFVPRLLSEDQRANRLDVK